MKKGTILIILLFTFAVILTNIKQDVIEENSIGIKKVEEKENSSISLIMAGDVLIHTPVYLNSLVDGTSNFDFMFEDVKKIINNYDLRFVNQESIIGGKEFSSYPLFNSPTSIGDTLVNAGFNIINLANNHTLDKGESGVIYSTNYWNSKDVYSVGSYNSKEKRDEIVIKEKNNITYSVLGYTTLTNGLRTPSGKDYLVNVYSDDLVKQDIEKVRDKVDVVIVSMHFGTEYTHIPIASQVRICEYLSSLGVDIVIGHHPHVIEPITYIGDTLVVYSLGNFLSGQNGEEKRVGMMVGLTIEKEDEIKIKDVTSYLTYTYREGNYPYDNIKIIPFSNLNNEMLPNYESIKVKYNNIINSGNVNVINR